jgi:hypothetical protein
LLTEWERDQEPFAPDLEFYTLRDSAQRHLRSAAARAGIPATLEGAQQRKAARIAFKPPTVIDTVGRLPLSATRKDLKQALSEIERHLGLPFER